ncbi:hypothetical protein AVEN_234331-1 [Araneus ventricosus]|uniref:Uncharacterized protein n=1 Tax=Araneus ventricosus TaxID=182803 RepID=A0A4Y2A8D4_ARAVE|nr:hypothetical protein AVEN_234331-1 [Araneus ventricosus]
MAPQPALISPYFRIRPARERLTQDVGLKMRQAYIHCGSWVESSFELGTLRSRSRDLTELSFQLGTLLSRSRDLTELSFQLGTLLSRSRDLTTSQPQPLQYMRVNRDQI